MGIYGIEVLGFFSRGISVILMLTCGIAVSCSSAVYGFSSFWLTVFGEIRLFTVLRYQPGGGTWVFFGWVCAARDSKLAPRTKKKFP